MHWIWPPDRQPLLFLSPGAPPLDEDVTWTEELHQRSAELPKPKNILVVQAHWERSPITVSAFQNSPGLTYDFWGFPEKYYQVTYDASPAPDLAMDPARRQHRVRPVGRRGDAGP